MQGRICIVLRLTSTGLNMATLAAAGRSLVSAAFAARRSLMGTFTMYRAEASSSRLSPAATKEKKKYHKRPALVALAVSL